MIPKLRMSTNQLSDFRSRTRQQRCISHSYEASLNEYNLRRIRNIAVFNVNNNVNLRFDMHKNDRRSTTVQEDDKEKDYNQKTINRGLLDYVEPSSDENQNTHSNDVIGNGMSHGISHRISQSSGGSHSDSRSSTSGTPHGNHQGSEGKGPVENGTASNNSISGWSSIGTDKTSPGTPSDYAKRNVNQLLMILFELYATSPL